MSVQENLKKIICTLPKKTKLVAVSKFHDSETVMEAYEAGQRVFGESRVQELTDKQKVLPKDIEWHFIGHLQTNKVKAIVPFISLIHSVDSLRLLKEIDKEAKRLNIITPVLLQIHIAKEETKFGLSFEECRDFFRSGDWIDYKNVKIKGLMGMATLTDDENQIKNEFHSLRDFFNEIKQSHYPSEASFCEISMGMSDDYQLAIAEGSTLIRIGTAIFGSRY
jgi:pyridoxal phosphate enzyme (YggS family)